MTPPGEAPHALRRAARLLFWLVLLFVAFVTLSPVTYRPETPLGADGERFVAFLVVGLLAGLGYPRRRLPWFGGLVLAAGLLEAAQTLVDGRHGRVSDFEVKAAGAAVGTLMALVVGRVAAALAPGSRA